MDDEVAKDLKEETKDIQAETEVTLPEKETDEVREPGIAEEVIVKCKNCDTILQGKYCHNCSQPASVGRIDYRFFLNDFHNTFLYVNKGFIYTLNELLVRPGRMIRNYLNGMRVVYFKPVLLVFVLATVLVLVERLVNYSIADPQASVRNTQSYDDAHAQIYADFLKDRDTANYLEAERTLRRMERLTTGNDRASRLEPDSSDSVSGDNSDLAKFLRDGERLYKKPVGTALRNLLKWLLENPALLIVMLIPILAFSLWISMGRKSFNYPEWIVITFFLAAQILFILIIMTPLKVVFPALETVSTLLIIGYPVYTLHQLRQMKKRHVILRVILAATLMIGLFIGLLILLFIVAVLLVMLFRGT